MEAEKRAANAKCLDLVETIAKTAQNAAQRTQQMKEEIEALKRDHEEAIQRVCYLLYPVLSFLVDYYCSYTVIMNGCVFS